MKYKSRAYDILAIHIFSGLWLFVRAVERHHGARPGDFIPLFAFILAGIWFSRSEIRKGAPGQAGL